MKLRIIDRLLAALAGMLLLALAVIPLADTLFGTDILVWLNKVAEFKTPGHLAFMLGGGALLLAVGLLLLHLATRRVKRKGFVVQATEVGELSISIRAIEDLVNRCVEKHDELHVSDTVLENAHDGLVIKMRVGLATGVNIPLAVTALQKQVKQYVTACSGVDVSEVKVQVETSNAKANPSIYTVPDMLENSQSLAVEEETDAESEAASAPVEAKEPEEKCLHQRLFSEEEQPAIVPEPPVEEAGETIPADETIDAWEKTGEEAEETTEVLTGLDTLSGLTDDDEEIPEAEEPEETEEAADCVADEESIAELAALDGAGEIPEATEEETEA